MTKNKISGGTVHKMPLDLQKVLTSDKAMLEAWEILPHLLVMNGFVGLYPLLREKQDFTT